MGRVQSARWDGLIRRLFSIKGGGSQLAETLSDAFPVLQLEGGPIELLRLSGFELGIVGQQFTSPVAQTVGAQIFNPVDSGKIVMPTQVTIRSDVASSFFFGVTAVALATAVVGRQRDTREGVIARAVAQSRAGNNPAPPIGAYQFRLGTAGVISFSDQNGLAVLAPGTGLTFTSVTTNVTVNIGWLWRERTAEPSELNF